MKKGERERERERERVGVREGTREGRDLRTCTHRVIQWENVQVTDGKRRVIDSERLVLHHLNMVADDNVQCC